MNIQLFAEDTEPEVSNEGIEEEVEYTDNENTGDEETETEVSEEASEEPEKVKTFTQDEVNNLIKDRIKRERNKVTKDYESELSKYKELAYLTQKGVNANDFDETLEKTRQYYEKRGITYTPERSTREEEILANVEAQDILDNCTDTEEVENEVNRLLKKGNDISKREKLVLNSLVGELENRSRVEQLNKLGVKADVYNSNDFKSFEKQFAKDTPISTIYELYRTKGKPTKVIENPGSMKSTPGKTKKVYITEAEYDKMSRSEIRANMDLIEKSMSKW